jgi:hypothetical protein
MHSISSIYIEISRVGSSFRIFRPRAAHVLLYLVTLMVFGENIIYETIANFRDARTQKAA